MIDKFLEDRKDEVERKIVFLIRFCFFFEINRDFVCSFFNILLNEIIVGILVYMFFYKI